MTGRLFHSLLSNLTLSLEGAPHIQREVASCTRPPYLFLINTVYSLFTRWKISAAAPLKWRS